MEKKAIVLNSKDNVATKDIKVGEHVHVHNVASTRGRGDVVKGAAK
jgi:hypothetical protein